MKKMRKLIPALAMLLVSAVMMSTASFAWFSMNTSVTASGMSVTAKNESKYLQIIAGADTSFHETEAQVSATAVNASKALRPTSLVSSIAEDKKSVVEYEGSTTLVWVEAFSNDPNVPDKATANEYVNVTTAATSLPPTAEQIEGGATDSNLYTLYNIFQVRMNPTTGVKLAGPLSVADVSVTATGEGNADLLPALRVAIVGTNKGAIYDSTGTLVAGNAAITTEVTDTASQVKVFVYFDGEDDAAFSNAVKSGNYAVTFTLTIP